MVQLVVNGERVDRLYEYSLRWLEDEKPVLYHLGQRVTQPWRLYVSHAEAGHPEESSANTAG